LSPLEQVVPVWGRAARVSIHERRFAAWRNAVDAGECALVQHGCHSFPIDHSEAIHENDSLPEWKFSSTILSRSTFDFCSDRCSWDNYNDRSERKSWLFQASPLLFLEEMNR